MLCNICKEKEATVHLTKVEGDKMHKVDLCDACSKENNVNDPSGGSLASIFVGLAGGEDAAPETETESELSSENCPTCGFTHADFKKTGRFGCPECYDAFAANLDGLLRTMHRDVSHVGKVPPSHEGEAAAEKLAKLESSLDEAVEREDFEKAADLRDEIKKLKGQMKKLGAKRK